MKTISIKDKQYRLAEYDAKMSLEAIRFACDNLPDPLEQIASSINAFPKDLQELMVREAMQAKRRVKSIEDPEVMAFLASPRGAAKVIALVWQKFQPELSDDDAWELHLQAVEEHGEDYIAPFFSDVAIKSKKRK